MGDDGKAAQGVWLKVFCPDARCLSPEEVGELPDKNRQAAQETGKPGLWLEVFCPDQACLSEGEKADAPTAPKVAKGNRGLWVNLFCPDGACVIEDDSRLP